jgi:glycosyltransferase involved in cell wall biosynthesis
MAQQLRVNIVWHGLPAYAARLVRSIIQEPTIDLHMFATKSPEDSRYLEEIIAHPIRWIDAGNARSIAEETKADVCFVTGWAFEACKQFARVAKARGTPVVAMIDNRWRGDLRQRLGSIYFRAALRETIDYAWVPGASAARLCHSLGFPTRAVVDGLYGGDGTVFTPALGDRPPQIGFVGQLIRRKGFDVLVEAFKQFRRGSPEYELHVYGNGDLESLAADVPGIVLHPFAKPNIIAAAMRNFRIFAMPSRDDNWPLALHEAALSGCPLVTTREVGNAGELVDTANGLVIPSESIDALASAFQEIATWPAERWHVASLTSRRLAEPFGPARWRREFLRLCAAATGKGDWA